jgi:hypothetical protein
MVASEVPRTARAGVQIACEASLFLIEGYPLVKQCTTDENKDAHRIWAAQTFAKHLPFTPFQDFCVSVLVKFFRDPNKEVRAKSSLCFDYFREAQLGDHASLVKAFLQSPAFDENFDKLISSLVVTTARLPEITCEACQKAMILIDRSDAKHTATMEKLYSLMIRGYSQSNRDSLLQISYLDLIDRAVKIHPQESDTALALYDETPIF